MNFILRLVMMANLVGILSGCAIAEKERPPKEGSLEYTSSRCRDIMHRQHAPLNSTEKENDYPYGSFQECMERSWPWPLPVKDEE